MIPEEIRAFAESEVFRTLAVRYEGRRFSRDIWRRMARTGLFGLLVPARYGGSGQGPEALVGAIEAFLQGGQDLGLCLSWLDHLLIHSHVINHFGSEEQRSRYLPDLVNGARIGALAASEPGSGADPVKMKTRAEKVNGTFRIYGRKIFITNGPVADYVLVLARTGPEGQKEGISAFLVEASSPGFRVEKEMDFGFLSTSPHGELAFEGCAVPAENLVGGLGDGHVRISRAVFGWERFVVIVALTAHLRLILDQTVPLLAAGAALPDRDTQTLLAELHVMLEGLREFARAWACEVLGRVGLDDRLTERLLFSAGLLSRWWDRFQPLLRGLSEIPPFPLGILLKDAQLLKVGAQLYELQTARVAEALLRKGVREKTEGG